MLMLRQAQHEIPHTEGFLFLHRNTRKTRICCWFGRLTINRCSQFYFVTQMAQMAQIFALTRFLLGLRPRLPYRLGPEGLGVSIWVRSDDTRVSCQ